MTPDRPHNSIFSTVQEYISLGMFKEALEKLKEFHKIEGENDYQYFMLLGKVLHTQGKLNAAYETVQGGLDKFPEEAHLIQRKNEYFAHSNKLRNAITEIENGEHTSDNINFARSNVQQLVDNKCFEEAIAGLSALAKARKAKTTNITWIGAALKDLYFHPEAEEYRDLFDDLAFEEMLFYYLKACKLFEPEYKVIQDAKKALKSRAS